MSAVCLALNMKLLAFYPVFILFAVWRQPEAHKFPFFHLEEIRDSQGNLFSRFTLQSKAAISVVSYLASEAFLCLLSLFASPDAYLCRLYPFFSLCLAMVAQIRSSFWTEGGHMV